MIVLVMKVELGKCLKLKPAIIAHNATKKHGHFFNTGNDLSFYRASMQTFSRKKC